MCEAKGRSCNSCASNGQQANSLLDIEDCMLKLETLGKRPRQLEPKPLGKGASSDAGPSDCVPPAGSKSLESPDIPAFYTDQDLKCGPKPDEIVL
jgi:hypothetical protein